VERTLVGFEMQNRLIARDGCRVSIGGKQSGRVTSGSPAPFLKKNIGMAYVPPASKAPGSTITIEIRGNQAPARIVSMPFYKRPK
jgi:aminomethyltransferase